MVGGLVEYHQIGALKDKTSECHPLALTAREGVGAGRQIGDVELGEELGQAVLIVPCACGIHLGRGGVDKLWIARGEGGLIVGHSLGGCTCRMGQAAFEHSRSGCKLWRLGQIAHADVGSEYHATAVGGLLAGYYFQQCRLAGAVAGNYAYFVAFINAEGHGFKQQLFRVAFCEVVDL